MNELDRMEVIRSVENIRLFPFRVSSVTYKNLPSTEVSS